MHAVRCPNCQRTLRLDRAVQDARLRCRHCGHIFVGSSVEVAGRARPVAPSLDNPLQQPPPPLTALPGASGPFPFPGAPGPEPAPPYRPGPYAARPPSRGHPGGPPPGAEMPVRPIRKKPSTIPLIIVCVGFVGIICLGIGAHWLATHKYREIHDDRGNILDSGYWTEEERARKEAEWKRRIGGEAGVTEPDLRTSPPVGPKAPGPGPAVHRPIPREPETPSGPAATVVDPTDMIAGDPKLLAMAQGQPVSRDETPTSGWIVGTVESRYATPVQVAKIAVYTYDVNDQRRPPMEGQCYYLPPGETVRFSIPYRGLSRGHIYKIIARAHSPARAADNVVSWAIPQERTNRANQARDVVISGQVENPFDFPVRNLKVHYDIYDSEGVQINSATKSAAKAPTSLPAGGAEDFTITFSPGETGYSVQMVRNWVIRVWAER